jgi:hypothetical protein
MKTYRPGETYVLDHLRFSGIDLSREKRPLLEPLARYLKDQGCPSCVLLGDWDYTWHGYVPTEVGRYGFAAIYDKRLLHLVWSDTTNNEGEFVLSREWLAPEGDERLKTEPSLVSARDLPNFEELLETAINATAEEWIETRKQQLLRAGVQSDLAEYFAFEEAARERWDWTNSTYLFGDWKKTAEGYKPNEQGPLGFAAVQDPSTGDDVLEIVWSKKTVDGDYLVPA